MTRKLLVVCQYPHNFLRVTEIRRVDFPTSDTWGYEQQERLVILEVFAIVLASFWLMYTAAWVISYVGERVTTRRRNMAP